MRAALGTARCGRKAEKSVVGCRLSNVESVSRLLIPHNKLDAPIHRLAVGGVVRGDRSRLAVTLYREPGSLEARISADQIVEDGPGAPLAQLQVVAGDKVEAGATLAIVEAMKMQNELRAPSDGVVKKVNFKEGDQVDAFIAIVELETKEK